MIFRNLNGELIVVEKYNFVNDKMYYKYIKDLKTMSKSKKTLYNKKK
mgnify:CR=1 FL=1|jgi:hypothetical protein